MNMVFVLIDDLPYNMLGFRWPGLKTPNIDRLAKSGVYLPNTVVTSSLCSPSRATILTGQTARNHRVVDNNNADESHLVYFPKYLQAAGYQTAYIGKWHMGMETDAPRPGFDYWVSFTGQGMYLPKGDFGPPQQQVLNVNGRHVDRTKYMTDELTDYQMNWLDKVRDPKKPFFLYMSHKAVHAPCVPAERHQGQYKQLEVTLPESFADTPENNRDKPMWVRNQRNSWHGIDVRYGPGAEGLKEEVRTCASVLSAVDDSLGQLLDYLRKNDLEKNTLVVLFSDNGSLNGAHGLSDKRTAYQESVLVPMIASAPGYLPANVVNPARVRNLDLAPTFLDVAGVQRPPQFEGRSVLPLLKGQAAWKDWPQDDFVYEYYWEWSYPMTPTTFAIVRNGKKYIQYHGVWDIEELYDLEKDPGEMHNLIFDPAYLATRVELRERLFKSMTNARNENVVPYTRRFNQGFVFRSKGGTPPADFPPQWVLEPKKPGGTFDFPELYPRSNAQ
ncbi:sulfatase family protein [Ramlibacter albus]|nr:sulfatase [Ramlibacter albus]